MVKCDQLACWNLLAANVSHFCEMMEERARATNMRFLVITRHPMTMKRMNRLFGVTMQEEGVSQLVRVDLRAKRRAAEMSSDSRSVSRLSLPVP